MTEETAANNTKIIISLADDMPSDLYDSSRRIKTFLRQTKQNHVTLSRKNDMIQGKTPSLSEENCHKFSTYIVKYYIVVHYKLNKDLKR